MVLASRFPRLAKMCIGSRDILMKRAWLSLFAAVALLLLTTPAFAGSINQIVLGGSVNTPIKFTGTGLGAFRVNFNISNLGASGLGTLSSSGFYSIVNNGSIVTTGGSCGGGCYLLSETGPLSFSYGSTAGGTDLLTGDLTLVSIAQAAQGGIFNDQLLVNFAVTGGSLASAFTTNNGIVNLTIKFTTKTSLAAIQLNQQLLAKVVSGAVFPVPEPASLMLLGGGLVMLA